MDKISEKTRELREFNLEHFDPEIYLRDFYTSINAIHDFAINRIFNAFKKYIDCNSSSKLKLLDFGSGPVPVYVASSVASGVPIEATLSDFLPRNRERLAQWREGAEETYFSKFFDLISKYSGVNSNDVLKMTRDSITNLESYDLTQDFSKDNEKYDVIISCFCIEASTTTKEEYEDHVKKVVGLLAKGGTIMINGIMESYYAFNDKVFDVFEVTESHLREIVQANGLQLLSLEIKARDESLADLATDFNGYFFLAAKK